MRGQANARHAPTQLVGCGVRRQAPMCDRHVDWHDVARWAHHHQAAASASPYLPGSAILHCVYTFPGGRGSHSPQEYNYTGKQGWDRGQRQAYQQNRQGAITSAQTCTFFCLQRHNWPNWPATHSMTAACNPPPAGVGNKLLRTSKAPGMHQEESADTAAWKPFSASTS